MDIPDWLSFFPFPDWSDKALFCWMLYWFDKAFPVQPRESGIPWFIQLYFCQSVWKNVVLQWLANDQTFLWVTVTSYTIVECIYDQRWQDPGDFL